MPNQRGSAAAVAENKITAVRTRRRMTAEPQQAARHVLVHASMNRCVVACVLVFVSGCACPDPRREDKPFASRAQLAAEIDACFAQDSACEPLCRKALALDM